MPAFNETYREPCDQTAPMSSWAGFGHSCTSSTLLQPIPFLFGTTTIELETVVEKVNHEVALITKEYSWNTIPQMIICCMLVSRRTVTCQLPLAEDKGVEPIN